MGRAQWPAYSGYCEEPTYEGIEDIWPDYIRKEDFFHNEEDEGFDYDDV